MSTYLQLAQRLARECGVSGTGPAAVTNQSGEAGRLVNWIASAWDDLQMARNNWYWMRESFTLTLAPAQRAYTPVEAGIATRFGMWDTKSLRLYKLTKADEIELMWLPYEDFRRSYLIGTENTSQPDYFTIDPQLRLQFGNLPDYAYTVNGEYYKANQTLAADGDTPEMPAQFHMAIVYRAMMMYGRYNSASEIYDDAKENYRRIVARLEMNQMPGIEISEPLA